MAGSEGGGGDARTLGTITQARTEVQHTVEFGALEKKYTEYTTMGVNCMIHLYGFCVELAVRTLKVDEDGRGEDAKRGQVLLSYVHDLSGAFKGALELVKDKTEVQELMSAVDRLLSQHMWKRHFPLTQLLMALQMARAGMVTSAGALDKGWGEALTLKKYLSDWAKGDTGGARTLDNADGLISCLVGAVDHRLSLDGSGGARLNAPTPPQQQLLLQGSPEVEIPDAPVTPKTHPTLTAALEQVMDRKMKARDNNSTRSVMRGEAKAMAKQDHMMLQLLFPASKGHHTTKVPPLPPLHHAPTSCDVPRATADIQTPRVPPSWQEEIDRDKEGEEENKEGEINPSQASQASQV